jgi:predicted esterase
MVNLFPPRHVYFPATPEHNFTVILLHDRGSNGPDLAFELATSYSTAGQTIFEHFPSTRWVFPSARARYYYWTQEQQSRGDDNLPEWFGLVSADDPEPDRQVPGLQESVSYILRIIDEEIRRLDGNAGRIFIGGVGQGMAVGLVALICSQQKLGAFVGATGWIPFAETLNAFFERGETDQAGGLLRTIIFGAAGQQQQQQQQQAPLQSLSALPPAQPSQSTSASLVDVFPRKAIAGPSDIKETPVFLSHDEDNSSIDIRLGKTACYILQRLGFRNLSWKTYNRIDDDDDDDDEEKEPHQWLKSSKQLDHIIQFLGENQLDQPCTRDSF